MSDLQSDPIKIHKNLSPETRQAIRDHLGPVAELPANQAEAASAFRALTVEESELLRCGAFVEDERARHEIARADAWVLLAIFWDNSRSPIHDHESSDCGFRVISGIVEETRYAHVRDDLVRPVATRLMGAGESAKSACDAIHCLGTPREEGGRALTLHLYCPILGYDAMGIYRSIDVTKSGADHDIEPVTIRDTRRSAARR